MFDLLCLIEDRTKTFQTIQSYIAKLKQIYQDKDQLETFLLKTKESSLEINEIILNKLIEKISGKPTILTFSNSRTVVDVLKELSNLDLVGKVIISESRPVLEGRVAAGELLDNNIKVELILEAQLPDSIKKSNIVFLGADAVLKNGNVINKTGSKLIALLCRFYNKPLYIVCDRSKIKEDDSYFIEKKNQSGIWDFTHQDLEINNYYFEVIDNNLITEIITD